MLTRNRLRRGEGKLEPFELEARCAHRRRNMAAEEAHIEEEHNFRKTFYSMQRISASCFQGSRKQKREI